MQYLALNFAPFLPLTVPFTFVIAQMVVRHGFEPTPVHADLASAPEAARISGAGLTLAVLGEESELASLSVTLPDGLVAPSPLARIPRQGRAALELAAAEPGAYEVVFHHNGRDVVKRLFAGGEARPRALQPERVTGLATLLWPAEDSLAGTGLSNISFVYPESELGWRPGSGPLGVILVLVVASILVGFAALKPLGVEI